MVTKKISLSFGCDDSRYYGDIIEDKFVVGITHENMDMIFQFLWKIEDQLLHDKN